MPAAPRRQPMRLPVIDDFMRGDGRAATSCRSARRAPAAIRRRSILKRKRSRKEFWLQDGPLRQRKSSRR